MKKILLFVRPDGEPYHILIGRVKPGYRAPDINGPWTCNFFTIEVDEDYYANDGDQLNHPYGWKIQYSDNTGHWSDWSDPR